MRRIYTIEELVILTTKRAIYSVMKQLAYVKPRGKAKKMPGGFIHRYF